MASGWGIWTYSDPKFYPEWRTQNRCLEGMHLLAMAFQRLLYKEFFAEKGIEKYKVELDILVNLKFFVAKK